ncbi:unnamed protein product [Acanthosepion pharaonis]|uniref:Uncharacterized protein n=1 Tax=Acanthosepion pharaonis TaxID=158019 RepID=A0A812BCL5_ACAPH|nr:unnamed protein product [Sepia pharaonis]
MTSTIGSRLSFPFFPFSFSFLFFFSLFHNLNPKLCKGVFFPQPLFISRFISSFALLFSFFFLSGNLSVTLLRNFAFITISFQLFLTLFLLSFLTPFALLYSSSWCLIMSLSFSLFLFCVLSFLLLLLILCLLLSNFIPLFPTFSFFLSSFYVLLLQPLSSFFRRLSFSFAIPVILSLVLSLSLPLSLLIYFFPICQAERKTITLIKVIRWTLPQVQITVVRLTILKIVSLRVANKIVCVLSKADSRLSSK